MDWNDPFEVEAEYEIAVEQILCRLIHHPEDCFQLGMILEESDFECALQKRVFVSVMERPVGECSGYYALLRTLERSGDDDAAEYVRNIQRRVQDMPFDIWDATECALRVHDLVRAGKGLRLAVEAFEESLVEFPLDEHEV